MARKFLIEDDDFMLPTPLEKDKTDRVVEKKEDAKMIVKEGKEDKPALTETAKTEPTRRNTVMDEMKNIMIDKKKKPGEAKNIYIGYDEMEKIKMISAENGITENKVIVNLIKIGLDTFLG